MDRAPCGSLRRRFDVAVKEPTRPDIKALSASTVGGEPAPRTVTAPGAFALDIDGDFDLGGYVFRDGIPFLHNDGGAATKNTALGLNALATSTPGYPPGLSASGNSAFGYRSLSNTTVGYLNTAIGAEALYSNTTGSHNVAVGRDALEDNVSGNYNVAVGAGALPNNTTGQWNTATGAVALLVNTTGSKNTANGAYALFYNSSGNRNVAVGERALFRNSTGYFNSAVGYQSLRASTTGYSNTAVGALALEASTTGYGNTAVGAGAQYYLMEGSGNTALGYQAGRNQEGVHNISIGAGVVGVAGDSYTTRIGSPQTRAFIRGIHGVTTGGSAIPVVIDGYGQLGTVSSSARFKEDIADLAERSDRLLDLRPVAFRYRQAHVDGSKPVQFGLIAEEVAEIFPELVVYGEDGLPMTIKYHLLSTLLLNELQKQEAGHDAQSQDLAGQSEEIRRLESELQALREIVADERRRIDRLTNRKHLRPN